MKFLYFFVIFCNLHNDLTFIPDPNYLCTRSFTFFLKSFTSMNILNDNWKNLNTIPIVLFFFLFTLPRRVSTTIETFLYFSVCLICLEIEK